MQLQTIYDNQSLNNPSLILGNRLNNFRVKIIRLSVNSYRQRRDDGLSNIVCKAELSSFRFN